MMSFPHNYFQISAQKSAEWCIILMTNYSICLILPLKVFQLLLRCFHLFVFPCMRIFFHLSLLALPLLMIFLLVAGVDVLRNLLVVWSWQLNDFEYAPCARIDYGCNTDRHWIVNIQYFKRKITAHEAISLQLHFQYDNECDVQHQWYSPLHSLY